MASIRTVFLVPLLATAIIGDREHFAPEIWVRGDWLNISTIFPENTLAFLANNTDEYYYPVRLVCQAKYPIIWKVSGSFSPTSQISVPGYASVRNFGKFRVDLQVDRPKPGNTLSVHLKCASVQNATMSSEIMLFSSAGNQSTIHATSLTVYDSDTIPCYTVNPTLLVVLFKKTPSGYITVKVGGPSYNFLPTLGFRKVGLFDGVFVCTQGAFSVSITAVLTSRANCSVDLTYCVATPIPNLIGLTKPERVTCTGNGDGNISIFENDGNFLRIEERKHGQTVEANISIIDWSQSVSTMLSCVQRNGQEVKVLNEWNVQDGIRFHRETWEPEAICLSNSLVSMRMQKCENTLFCEMYREHQSKSQTFIVGNLTKFFGAGVSDYAYFVKATLVHSSGIVTCKAGEYTEDWLYFTGLSNQKYADWNEAPINDLVRMDDVPYILYSGRQQKFICEASAFLFAEHLQFEIIYMNGSKLVYEYGQLATPDLKVKNLKFGPRYVDGVNQIYQLELEIKADMSAVRCGASFGNSTDTLWTSRTFEVRELSEPMFTNFENKDQDIYLDDESRKLTCGASGEPSPDYMWYFNGVPVSQIFPGIKTSVRTTSFLEFPKLSKQSMGERFTGVYECRVNNSLGNKSQTINIKVKERMLQEKPNVALPVTIGSVSFILLLVLLVALYVVFQRYKKATNVIRDLTEMELKEFFDGRPDLLSNSTSPAFEQIDDLPYNNDYEIQYEDIEFEESEKRLLGSGQFALVLKGNIVSQALPAAIKVSKPSSDVTLFKSLLSEVKIMIYIGHNDNVLKLLGVCTAGIRTQTIYILTELCELGSLENILRDSSGHFVNLLNANHQIDVSLATSNPPTAESCEDKTSLSTLDLILFSKQIASGMCFLTEKKVIHADLAARNVLLTATKCIKISDFGLSKKLYEEVNYQKRSTTPLPWRWMAPESLTKMIFSVRSDVWSYGVTLFEIFSLGGRPFPNETWSTDFVERLSSGMRMGRPKYSTPEIYGKMVSCWEQEPDDRPDFSTLFQYFTNLQRQHFSEGNSEETHPKKVEVNRYESPHKSSSATGVKDLTVKEVNDAVGNQYQNISTDAPNARLISTSEARSSIKLLQEFLVHHGLDNLFPEFRSMEQLIRSHLEKPVYTNLEN